MARRPVSPPLCSAMEVRHVVVRASDVVFVKGVLEASEGLAQVFAERGGDLTIAVPKGRGGELDTVLADLAGEMDLLIHS